MDISVERVLSKVVRVADSCTELIEEVSVEVRSESEGLAKVFTEAIGIVSVEGEGRACSEGEGEGSYAFVYSTAVRINRIRGVMLTNGQSALVLKMCESCFWGSNV